MSSEIITSNDLRAILNEILPSSNIISTTITGLSGTFTLYRIGNVVFVNLDSFVSKNAAIANATALSQTIPFGYRPINNSYIMIVTATATNKRLDIDTSGVIKYYGNDAWPANGTIWASGSWITNDDYPTT